MQCFMGKGGNSTSCGCVSGKCVHIDRYKIEIMQDVNTIDLVHLSDAMLELKYRRVIDCHFEFVDRTEDLHL